MELKEVIKKIKILHFVVLTIILFIVLFNLLIMCTSLPYVPFPGNFIACGAFGSEVNAMLILPFIYSLILSFLILFIYNYLKLKKQ
ncbi:hypothetical protein KKB11_03300 [Candidatus Micrarchaeota archaeon]|nr:hypothetical protein [Candidatus Micrarchaeota archaeon]